ncbi:hypothetical protein MOLA814_00066 [Betaproteobacteria bacterium MOLA814]|nr:hypothetical protein MOLA814_00066 [Betaproteobacteria bacterium MOLA814]
MSVSTEEVLEAYAPCLTSVRLKKGTTMNWNLNGLPQAMA